MSIMHELSIAHELLNLVAEHTPAGMRVTVVRVQAGAMQAIDDDAMQLAWQAATQDSPFQGSRLELDLLPWRLSCEVCGRTWEGEDAFESCACGNPRASVTGSNDLMLTSLDVEETSEHNPSENLSRAQCPRS